MRSITAIVLLLAGCASAPDTGPDTTRFEHLQRIEMRMSCETHWRRMEMKKPGRYKIFPEGKTIKEYCRELHP